MKKLLLLVCLLGMATVVSAQQYASLDRLNPIEFKGDHILYQGEKIMLGEKALFIDGQLSDEIAAQYPYVFNSFTEAAKHLSDGTEAEPMALYLAPWVYWVDDPDDPAIRTAPPGRSPFGMEIKCDWLRFEGLNPDPQNVVLASNRGQTMGSEGNFTMFFIDGDGASSENITFGNYCNIDLEFPLLPRLNREKRGAAIVQAQLVICNSDKVVARNTRFVSRLNLCPFSGAKRALFDNCYFESTDDALCGTGLYLDCRLVFYGSKPFYATQGTGAIFLNCDFDLKTEGQQYLTKAASPVAIVDSRFTSADRRIYLGWTGAPTDDLRCYQYNVSLNGKAVFMDKDMPWLTVDMTDRPVLDAYRFEYEGEVVYNTYNLLRGQDDWDPMGVKETVWAAEQANGKNYTDIPTYLKITPTSGHIESGVTTAQLTVDTRRFGNPDPAKEPAVWSVYGTKKASVVQLTPDASGSYCEVAGINENDETQTVWIIASTPGGLQSASVLTVAPTFLHAPKFSVFPKMSEPEKGKLQVNYRIDLGNRRDESLITWYRCTDNKGLNAVEVAVSRLNDPERFYELSPGDVGYYIMATVAPKHLRSHPGQPEGAVTVRKIEAQDVQMKNFYTDFHNFSVKYQPKVLPGFWTVDSYKPEDTSYYDWKTSTRDSWAYEEGVDGAAGILGLTQVEKGARLLYTPTEGTYGDMSVTLNVAPGKQAGQGFGSATGQYMDIYIKFDTRTLSGYALRIIRTTKFSDAVDFVLIKYENGVTSEISDPVSSVCYRTTCTIELSIEGNLLKVHAETDQRVSVGPGQESEVNLEAEITPTAFGGTGIQHTGSTGPSATSLENMRIEWK